MIKSKQEFHQLFQDYYPVLCNFLLRYVHDKGTREDLVQSVFARLWENRDKIEVSDSVKSYLFSAARNAALDHIRSLNRKNRLIEGQEEVVSEQPADFETAVQQAIFRQKLHHAISQLKPKTRQIFTLHKMEGLTYQEISEHMNIPKRTVEYNVYSALAQLRDALAEDYKEYQSGS